MASSSPTEDFILDKYKIDRKTKSPIRLNCTRWGTIPRLFRQLGFKVGAEVGVAGGRFSKFLCEFGNQKVYAVDAWQIYKGYKDNESQDKMEALYKEARNRLKPFNCQVVRDWSDRASRRFDDGTLDFVFIDCNHSYASVKKDLALWIPKVRKGGIISGHDYINGLHGITYGVKQAVNEYVAKHKIRYLFILVKDSNIDQCPSWMFVNQ